ncbi:putative immunoglobulin-blocking virulence protein [Mesomycoplasma hyorhinis]|uniref:putative immunoglobulin-blocking virulence protein n=1 Tax=Mesomycoplasma hyorhinis TaxID=2100 RepID=UPI001C05975C|nr:putative immunoglobulin-blocking virulence protein [Mesomycoplasma hyorhinis]
MNFLKKTKKFLKKSKNQQVLFSFVTVLSVPSVVGIIYYVASKNTDSKEDVKILDKLNANSVTLQSIENADTNKALDALNDKNLKPNPKPEEKKPDSVPTPPVVVNPPKTPPKTPKPEPAPEPETPPVVEPAPEPETPPVVEPAPSIQQTFKDDETGYVTLKWEGHDVRALVRKKPNRQYSTYDNQNGLANRIPYQSQVIDEIINIEVTPEIQAQNLKNTATALKNSVQGSAFSIYADTISQGDKAVAAVVAQNYENYYKNMFSKWQQLFDNGDKVREFLTKEGYDLYPTIKQTYENDLKKAKEAIEKANQEMEQLQRERPPRNGFDSNGRETFTDENKLKLEKWQVKYNEQSDEVKAAKQLEQDAKNVKYAKLIYYLDYNKLVKGSKENEEYLKKGFTINPDNTNITVDADGTLHSYSWSPILNQVTSLLQRDNEERRAFGYSSYYGRSGGDILNGTYEGWTKTDVTNGEEYKKYNVSKSDGINISKLTKNADNKAKTSRNEGIVVTVDFSNPSGYERVRKLIKELTADHKEITSYRFFHIGKNDANQKFKDILAELPTKLPQLELLMDSTNTSALLALENKQIDELSIYTEGNSLSDDWAINPWALKNVAWYNTNDYNVSFDYAPGAKVATRVTFNSLAFDDSDYTGGHEPKDYKRINDGLRMAYWTRNNEKVFQGGWGPGLQPDVNESENSYPTGLDLTRVTKMKSLRGLNFTDTQKSSNSKPRKLTRIGLYNNSNTFEIDVDELNNAHFDVLDTSVPMAQPKPKIFFSNDGATKRIKVVAKGSIHTLTSTGASNLNILLENGRQKHDDTKLFTNRSIIVDKSDSQLINSLKNQGFNVDESGTSSFHFN